MTRTVNIDDDEQPPTLTLSGATDALNVTEESTATFTVSIVPPSTKSVSVTLTSSDTNEDIFTVSPKSLTFAANATAAQTVTVTALDDSNTDDESGTITLTATLNSVTATVEKPVAVRDNDIPAGNLELDSTAPISLQEGGTGSFTVKLSRRPSKNVTVAIASADPGAVSADPASLTFTANNWETVQSVTV
ncbi:MAG: hypothetical protein ISN28_13855, partial [Ectothiorhodospiraceae bacterium AqS1]|nr:hypothetical protein [Ectothiorhodospiraceae bacterium AqS1]